jgi:hypothetical protein
MPTTATRGPRHAGRCDRKPLQRRPSARSARFAEGFITGAAAAGNTRLGSELNTLRAAHGEEAFLTALGRAVAFGRWRAGDMCSILAAAGAPSPRPRPAGDALVLELELPVVGVRSLAGYAIDTPNTSGP